MPDEWRRQRREWSRDRWDELRAAGITPLDWLQESRAAVRRGWRLEPRGRQMEEEA